MNALSPGLYIFWTLVIGPILVAGQLARVATVWGRFSGRGLPDHRLCIGRDHCRVPPGRPVWPQSESHMVGISALVLLIFGLFQISKNLRWPCCSITAFGGPGRSRIAFAYGFNEIY